MPIPRRARKGTERIGCSRFGTPKKLAFSLHSRERGVPERVLKHLIAQGRGHWRTLHRGNIPLDALH